MVTYLVGTDGTAASEAISDHLEVVLRDGDLLEVVNAMARGSSAGSREGANGLATFEDRFREREVVVSTRQVNREGLGPAETVIELARELEADAIVLGLRHYSRTERILSGSVARAVVEQSDLPVTLVPIPSETNEA